MAPVTRARRRRDSIPLVQVLDDPSSSHPALELPPQLEDSTTPTTTPKPRKQRLTTGGTGKPITRNQSPSPSLLPENNPTNPTAADSESDSDSEAPEAVSLDTGREIAKKAQNEAKRAAEAQTDAARKKRKARDAKLKEQKEEANERKKKQRKVNPEGEEEEEVDNPEALTIAGRPAEPPVHEANATNSSPPSPPPPVEQQLTKPNLPTLLPETLLAQVTATKRRHYRESESDPNPEPEQKKKQVNNTGTGGRNAERNRRKKQRQKLNRTLKKGPVSVKVLKDDTKSRKILPPPAAKVVGSIKDSWLFGRKTGGAMRRDVITGFVRK